ncbi:MAG TPA: M56 family metallopeptidase, partial [Lachnospiraceae bacterium]|nr:M56 family metallopeptidase [Lachnospiraceae bacterium]
QVKSGRVESDTKQNLIIAILLFWGIGAVTFLLYHFIGNYIFRKRVTRWGRSPQEERVTNSVTRLRKEMRIKGRIEILQSNEIVSPCIVGIFRPLLLIPYEEYSDKELTFILKHELTHYRRRDVWYKLLILTANAIHWFNPIVYLLRYESNVDLEASCDDEVVRNASLAERKEYSEAIISCINHQWNRKVALSTFFYGNKSIIKKRFRNIMDTKRKRNGFLATLIVILLVASVGGLIACNTNGGEAKEGKESEELIWYGDRTLIPEGTKLPDDLIDSDDEMNDFLDSKETIALVAAIPEEGIYVYGLKENGSGTEEDFLFRLNALAIRQGNEIQVYDMEWGVYSELPRIQYRDYDQDGQKELAMINKSVSGTGISLQDLHVFEKAEEGGFVDHYYDMQEWAKELQDSIRYEVKDGKLTIYMKDEIAIKDIDIEELEKEWEAEMEDISVGNFVEYTFEDGKIYLQAVPEAILKDRVTPEFLTDIALKAEVIYKDGFNLKF